MISFENISKQYGSTLILDHASFSLNEKERTGLIGPNGSGKTTLLRMLCGQEESDRGVINKPSSLSIGYLPQEVEIFDEMSAMDIVLSPFKRILSYEERIQSIGDSFSPGDEKGIMEKIDSIHAAMERYDVYSLRARAEAILCGLGISQERWDRPVRQLSGGYRMRAVLGQLLLTAPDFLLLDEPTNHLDMDSLVWLERFLVRSKSGMLIVSHDRDFLNRITTYTAGIERARVSVSTGNYDQYVRVREEMLTNDANRARNIAEQISRHEQFVERFRYKATKATQAQSRIKLIGKLRAEMPEVAPANRRGIHFSFPAPKLSGQVPFNLRSVTTGYNGVPVIENLSLSINRGDKIAVIGPNGSGKTTLLKLLAGVIQPLAGAVEIGANVSVRYFGQHQLEQLDATKNCYETVIADSVNTEKTFVRNILGAFLFSGDAVEKSVSVLSGGEKARLVLATILAGPGNVLLLDEPTNHLDIDSIEMLADAMAAFEGTIVFVSHDEYFISRIADRIVEVRPGVVRDYPGSLADYRFYVETFSGMDSSATDAAFTADRKSDPYDERSRRKNGRENRKKLQRAIEKCERSIEEAELRINYLKDLMCSPDNACDHELLYKTSLEHDETKKSLDELLREWEAKLSELEALGNG